VTEPAFIYETDIATTPERLWAALTSGELTRQYWFDRRVESDWTAGAPVRFYDGASDTVTDTGVVVECDPPNRLVYTFAPVGWPATRVAFTIGPAPDGRVRLRLVQDQLAQPEDVDQWKQGWSPILAGLQRFLESGGVTAAWGEGGTLSLSLRIAAPPDVVYRALTEADQMRRWWPPEGWTTTVREVDVRVGGQFALTNVMPDGTPVELRGTYREAEPGRRLTHTFRALGDSVETVVTFELTADGDHTLLTLTEVGLGEGPDAQKQFEAGWMPGMEKLARLVV
jgi:uncharacterized protein YndB with AHSA1/START domain